MTVCTGQPAARFRDDFQSSPHEYSSPIRSPMPRSVPEKLAEYGRDGASSGESVGTRLVERPVAWGTNCAAHRRASDEVGMMPNVTIAQTAILSAIVSVPGAHDRDDRARLPLGAVAYAEMAKRFGARVVVVKSATVSRSTMKSERGDRWRTVSSRYLMCSSQRARMDADAICARAHEMGALVSLDSFHAVGFFCRRETKQRDFLTGGV